MKYIKLFEDFKFKNITQDDIIHCIKNNGYIYTKIIKNRNDSGRRFNVNGIYSYNFDADDLFEYTETDDSCFKEYKQVENIAFKPSFDYFQHHNSLFVFFTNEKSKNTRKSVQPIKKKTLKNV